MDTQRSLIAEAGTAIAAGSAGPWVETQPRRTDIFLVGRESYSEAQIGVFDDAVIRLTERIETKARIELARRLKSDLSKQCRHNQ